MKLPNRFVVVLWLSALPVVCLAQNPWREAGFQSSATAEAWVRPERFRAVALDELSLTETLAQAKLESDETLGQSKTDLVLPMPDGASVRFRIVESPVMAPALAAKFPGIRTYLGQGIDDPGASARMDWTPAGFHAQVLSTNGAAYIDPAFRNDRTRYVCYWRRDHKRMAADFVCLAAGGATATPVRGGVSPLRASGANLRTYRLACAATGEYTLFHGGTVTDGLAAIVTAVNRVTGVYEIDVAIRLQLVGNNDLIVYTNATTDPYANSNGSAMLSQNQSNLDAVIGSGSYDIGHVFSTGGGGIAGLGVVCLNGSKARGVTGGSSPTGDSFWIDYVAHEMGHQFGANHPFNSTTDNCGGGNRNAATAYEPGSGSTIMAYAGICGTDDLQPHSDPYFHAISFDEIVVYSTLGSGDSCAVNSLTGNTPPSVSAGSAYTIPRGTPFTLTATGSDADLDPLTYCWEQMDLGPATTLSAPDNGSSPIFRSFNPTSSPTRTFPQWSDILNNRQTPGEKLPNTSRTLHFRVTVRDNRAGGGGANTADTTVTSVGSAGPFVITAPNASDLQSGFLHVTWNVAGTADPPINAETVNILLSTDGGTNFPILLSGNTPNDGSETVLLPSLTTDSARIRVEAVGNIFFDVSKTNFPIVPASPIAHVILDSTTLLVEGCTATNGAVDPGETVTMNVGLRNNGLLDTTNLVATLLETNGLVLCSAPQAYGVLVGGGLSVTLPFTFTAVGVCGGSCNGQIRLQDGDQDMGTVSVAFALGAQMTSTQSFTNSGVIAIPATSTSGRAGPYPSTINVSGVSGPVSKVTLALAGLSHSYPDDIDALLVAPNGQSVLFLSDAGGNTPAVGLNLTFDDAAASAPGDSTALATGTYQPSNYGAGESFLTPAPPGPYVSLLSVFNGIDPNGTWSLYIMDDATADIGSVSQGWRLNITTLHSACCDAISDLAVSASVSPAALNVSNSAIVSVLVTNPGPAAALDVSLSNAVPSGFTILTASASQGASATNGNVVTAALGPITNGGTASLTITVQAQIIGTWTNETTISSSTTDSASSNNFTSVVMLINSPPTISGLLDTNTPSDTPLGPLAFEVGDLETPVDNLTLSGGSSDTNLVPESNLVFGGSGTNRTLSIQPGPGLAGSATITVYVGDGLATNSASFVLTVTESAAPPPQLLPVTISGSDVSLSWTTAPGHTYRVQFKNDLDSPDWTDLGPDLPAVGPILTATDTLLPEGRRFYRVLLVH